MRLTKKIVAVGLLGVLWGAKASAQGANTCSGEVSYTFQRGETLSAVLRVIGKTRLWGANGRVAKVVASQPQGFVRSAFGHVLEGATLVLPVEFCPRFPGWKIERGMLLREGDIAVEKMASPASEKRAPDAVAVPTAAPTPVPTPEDTPLTETDLIKARGVIQNDESGYSKILESLQSGETKGD